MALITTPIGEQGYEKVRDAIGAILLLELTNQKTLQGFDEEIKIYRERLTPMQSDDNLYLNVLLDNAQYSNKTPADSQGLTLYNIDAYGTGITNGSVTGDLDSATRIHKFLGMCRYILDSTHYNRLGLPLGLISGVAVQSINMLDAPIHEGDSDYTRFGRLTVAVRICENQALWDSVELLGNDTQVKLDETDRGFVYTLNNE